MPASCQPERIAILWQLAWTDDSILACSVYRDACGWQLRLEAGSAVVIAERCELQPRTMARARALRDSLKRRGWHESPTE